MSEFSLCSTSLTPQYRLRLGRFLLRSVLSFVVGFFLALPFPLLGAVITELAPGQTFPATGAPGNLLLLYGLRWA